MDWIPGSGWLWCRRLVCFGLFFGRQTNYGIAGIQIPFIAVQVVLDAKDMPSGSKQSPHSICTDDSS